MSDTETSEREGATAGECASHDSDSILSEREMSCPVCGDAMPDLKGGKGSICPNCGFKDSCCY